MRPSFRAVLRPSKEILIKIAGLLAALFVLALLAVVGLHKVEADTIREILQAEEQEHGRLLDGVLSLAGEPLRLMVDGYAARFHPEATPVLDAPGGENSILQTTTALFGLDGAWVLDADGIVRERAINNAEQEVGCPIVPQVLKQVKSREMHFFAAEGKAVFEVRGLRLQPASDGTPSGWIFAASRLDGIRLTQPYLPVEGFVSLEESAVLHERDAENSSIWIDRPLRDIAGEPLRVLRLTYQPDEVEATRRAGELARRLVGIFVLWSLSVLGFSLWRWVVRPAMLMQASLATRDVKRLEPLFAAGGDLARLAGFVRSSLENQDSLQRTMEERVRLGRDLHDGVIQTIYSAGLGLARGRNYLATDPAKAETLLLEVRASLDEAVKDLRRYIGVAEAEPTRRETLREALLNLKVIAHLEPGCTVDVTIEPEADAKLSRSQQTEILFIASEAFSNGLRHGGASKLEFSLVCKDGHTLILRVCDNGRGFDPASSRNPFGQGMSNLRERAVRLGGELSVDTSPDRGTRLKIEFKSQ